MLRVGLTGGIASGKSTVTGMLRALGAPVVDADASYHRTVQSGSETLAEIVREFGDMVLRPDGTLNREALGSIVFADTAARLRLEAITHPAVRNAMSLEAAEHERQGHPVCFFDIPLLIETGLYKNFPRIWLVFVDRETQLERLIQRNNLTRAEAEQRLNSQMPMEQKVPYAQVVIDNRGSREETEAQVRRHYQALLAGLKDEEP